MPDFSTRSQAIEIMDNLNCSGEVVNQTLRELEFINHWLGGNQVTIGALNKLLPSIDPAKEIVIADLGCGSGDMLRLINRWAMKRGLRVKLIGIDANPNIVGFARSNVNGFSNIEFKALDIFSKDFQKLNFDIVIGTLFYHHFSETQLKDFFAQLRNQVQIGFIINDIHRHPLAYYSIKFLTALFSKSSMVKFDAPLSVLRAFSKAELMDILQASSQRAFTIHWKWAFRWQVIVKV